MAKLRPWSSHHSERVAGFVVPTTSIRAPLEVWAAELLVAVSALPHTVTVVVFTDGNDSVDDGAIDRMVESLMTLGVHAVIPSVAATEAVKRVQAGLVVESIDRSTLNPLRTPEVVDRRFLEAALAGVDGSQPVNPSRLVASAGGLVHVDR